MSEMSNEQINRTIAEWMGQCWHEQVFRESAIARYECKCGIYSDSEYDEAFLNPDYCSKSSPRSLLAEAEGKIICEFGAKVYATTLNRVLDVESTADVEQGLSNLILATAQQRATALYRLIKEKQS